MCGAWRWWLPVLWQSLIEDSRKTNGKMTEEWWLTIDEAIGEWRVLIDEFWKEEREGKREIAREKGRVPKDKSRKWGNWRVQKNNYKWLLLNGFFWWTSSEYTSILVVMLILEISSENRDRRRKEKGRVEWQCLRCMIDECGLTNKSKETKKRIKPITRNYWWTRCGIWQCRMTFSGALKLWCIFWCDVLEGPNECFKDSSIQHGGIWLWGIYFVRVLSRVIQAPSNGRKEKTVLGSKRQRGLVEKQMERRIVGKWLISGIVWWWRTSIVGQMTVQ